MKTVAAIDITVVTPEQIGRCSKCFSGKTAYYLVLSESDNLTEYQVKYSKEHGFTCSCPAGQRGFSGCKAGYCKHVSWAVAAAAEEKAALAELRQAAEEKAAPAVVTNVDQATLERVMSAKAKPASHSAKPYQPRGFSLLR